MLIEKVVKKIDQFFDWLNIWTYRDAIGRYLVAIVLILLVLSLRFFPLFLLSV